MASNMIYSTLVLDLPGGSIGFASAIASSRYSHLTLSWLLVLQSASLVAYVDLYLP